MAAQGKSADSKAVWVLSAATGLIGGMCCVTPIVLVLAGLASISAANSLGNWLYGDHRWAFRGAALFFLAMALVVYFRRQGICTLDEARRQRNRVVNFSLLALIGATGMYMFWTYVVVHYWGILAGLPWAQYDESWAIPWSLGLLGAAGLGWIRLRRGGKKVLAANGRK